MNLAFMLRFAFVPTDQLQLSTQDGTSPGQRVLTLNGVLTSSTLFAFQDFVHSDESNSLIVDMSGVPYIDSAGLGSLISAYTVTQAEQTLAVAK